MSGSLTLATLLEHPANGGLTVASRGDREWTSVVVEVRESDLPDEARDALAVLVAPAPGSTWQVDALLRRVRDRGFTGVALTGRPIGPGSRALAQRLGIVVLHADRPTRLAQVCWEVLEARDALTLSTVRRIARSIEYRAQDLDDLLGNVAANVGHGIALVDGEGVLQSAGDPLPESLRREITFGRWLDVVETSDGMAASVPVESRSRHGLRIVLFAKDSGTAHRIALSTAVEVVMPIVAARLLVDEVEAVSDVSRASGLLGDFLEARGSIDAETGRRMIARGWRTSGYHLGFRMIGRPRLDPLELLRFITTRLGSLPVDSHATTRGGGVTGWLSFTESPEPAVLASRVRDLHELHSAALASFRLATGIGSLASGPEGLAATLGEASDAARLAGDRQRAGWFLHIDSLGLGQLLLAWTGGDTFMPAAQSLLSPLGTGDQRLLATYLDQESSTGATAQRLGLHRNTVATRIQRIQTLLGADLRDPETRLALHLATRVTAAGPRID